MDADRDDPHVELRREIAKRFGDDVTLVVKADESGRICYHIGRIADPIGLGPSLVKTYGCGRTPEEALRDVECYFKTRARARDERKPAFERFEDYIEARERKRSRRRDRVVAPGPGTPDRAFPGPTLTHADHVAQRAAAGEVREDRQVEF